jgi:hypothetical protein
MAAGVRLLAGAARVAAGVAFVAVVVVLGFSGGYLLVPAVVAALALTATALGGGVRVPSVSAHCAAGAPARARG